MTRSRILRYPCTATWLIMAPTLGRITDDLDVTRVLPCQPPVSGSLDRAGSRGFHHRRGHARQLPSSVEPHPHIDGDGEPRRSTTHLTSHQLSAVRPHRLIRDRTSRLAEGFGSSGRQGSHVGHLLSTMTGRPPSRHQDGQPERRDESHPDSRQYHGSRASFPARIATTGRAAMTPPPHDSPGSIGERA